MKEAVESHDSYIVKGYNIVKAMKLWRVMTAYIVKVQGIEKAKEALESYDFPCREGTQH